MVQFKEYKKYSFNLVYIFTNTIFLLYLFIEKPQEYAKTMLTRKLMFYSVKRIFKIIFTVFYKCLYSNIIKTQCTLLYNTVQHQFKRI